MLKIFAHTWQLLNRSPQVLQRRSFSTPSSPPSSRSPHAPKLRRSLGDIPYSISADFDRLRMAFHPGGANIPAELGPELPDVFSDVRSLAIITVSLVDEG